MVDLSEELIRLEKARVKLHLKMRLPHVTDKQQYHLTRLFAECTENYIFWKQLWRLCNHKDTPLFPLFQYALPEAKDYYDIVQEWYNHWRNQEFGKNEWNHFYRGWEDHKTTFDEFWKELESSPNPSLIHLPFQ